MRVLVADDDPDYRLLVKLALEPDTRFSVVGEAGGNELVAAVEKIPADLALIDVDMAGGVAFDALPRLRRVAPACHIILLSSHGVDDLQRASRATGAVGYLRKDTAASRLADELWALTALVGAVSEVLMASSTRFGPDLRSAREARRFVTSALDSWGIGDLAEVVTLLVSELVTNAIVHAESEVDVAVKLTPDVARVEVSDTSEAEPVMRPADNHDESGRGLAIVDSFSRAWGVRPHPGGGKTIWFEVVRPRVSAAP